LVASPVKFRLIDSMRFRLRRIMGVLTLCQISMDTHLLPMSDIESFLVTLRNVGATSYVKRNAHNVKLAVKYSYAYSCLVG